jgi:hypothetical protein
MKLDGGKKIVKPLKAFTLPTVIDAKVGLADRLEETLRGRASEVLVSGPDERPSESNRGRTPPIPLSRRFIFVIPRR